jgi:hypothetical protein
MKITVGNINIEFTVKAEAGRVRVSDQYGTFMPFSWPHWVKCVEQPFAVMRHYNPKMTKYRVIEIMLNDFHYMYIGNN